MLPSLLQTALLFIMNLWLTNYQFAQGLAVRVLQHLTRSLRLDLSDLIREQKDAALNLSRFCGANYWLWLEQTKTACRPLVVSRLRHSYDGA